MTGYGFYQVYQPLNLHFTTSYDVFKYNSTLKTINGDTYAMKDEVKLFEKWGNKFLNREDAAKCCLANFVYGDSKFVYRDMQCGFEVFNTWKEIKKSIYTVFEQDCEIAKQYYEKTDSWNGFVSKTKKGNLAPLLQLYMHKYVHPESIVILDRIMVPFVNRWLGEFSLDPLVSDTLAKLIKYSRFVTIDLVKCEEISQRYFNARA